MVIEKRLPFEVCETCPEFILDVEQQELWYGDCGTQLALLVQCKNAGKCRQLKQNLNNMGAENAQTT